MLLSIFNIRMKKKGAVMDYGNEKLSYFFFMYHGMLLAVMEKRYKKIEKGDWKFPWDHSKGR